MIRWKKFRLTVLAELWRLHETWGTETITKFDYTSTAFHIEICKLIHLSPVIDHYWKLCSVSNVHWYKTQLGITTDKHNYKHNKPNKLRSNLLWSHSWQPLTIEPLYYCIVNETTGSKDEMFKAENWIKTKHICYCFAKAP